MMEGSSCLKPPPDLRTGLHAIHFRQHLVHDLRSFGILVPISTHDGMCMDLVPSPHGFLSSKHVQRSHCLLMTCSGTKAVIMVQPCEKHHLPSSTHARIPSSLEQGHQVHRRIWHLRGNSDRFPDFYRTCGSFTCWICPPIPSLPIHESRIYDTKRAMPLYNSICSFWRKESPMPQVQCLAKVPALVPQFNSTPPFFIIFSANFHTNSKIWRWWFFMFFSYDIGTIVQFVLRHREQSFEHVETLGGLHALTLTKKLHSCEKW